MNYFTQWHMQQYFSVLFIAIYIFACICLMFFVHYLFIVCAFYYNLLYTTFNALTQSHEQKKII